MFYFDNLLTKLNLQHALFFVVKTNIHRLSIIQVAIFGGVKLFLLLFTFPPYPHTCMVNNLYKKLYVIISLYGIYSQNDLHLY